LSKKKLAGIIVGGIIAIIIIAAIAIRTPTPTYTLSVSVNPAQAGSVSPSGGEYKSGLQITLTATPASGYTFDFWDGAASSSSNTITITMNSNKTVTAHFEVIDHEQTPESENLTVHFIDVRQGDSILLDLGDTEVLIDGGDKSPGVVSYIDDYVDGPLEVMVATHPHADHIGGLIGVLDAFKVDEIWLNVETSTSETYSQFMSAVDSEDAEVHVARRGDTIHAGNLTFNVLSPVNLGDDTNNNSIVLSLSYGQVDFLFTGDAQKEAEASILAAGIVADVDILKVGHHGSRTASSMQFLEVAKPEHAIYMAAQDNSYGHPHSETITNLREIGAEIYGTDIHGTVIVTTDGVNYTVTPSNSVPPVVCPDTATEEETSVDSDVQITYIFYDGIVYRTESDEYVEITNLGDTSQDLKGWTLLDKSEGYPSLTFPTYVLQPGQSIRVYTNEIHPQYGGFSFGSAKAVWNNSSPDTAVLMNAQGQEVSRKSY
jgi:beta-lactamase superfamily II metal-dependent hydrolase